MWRVGNIFPALFFLPSLIGSLIKSLHFYFFFNESDIYPQAVGLSDCERIKGFYNSIFFNHHYRGGNETAYRERLPKNDFIKCSGSVGHLPDGSDNFFG